MRDKKFACLADLYLQKLTQNLNTAEGYTVINVTEEFL
jgi:hypothetical protein